MENLEYSLKNDIGRKAFIKHVILNFKIDVIFYRVLYHFFKLLYKGKNIWLFFDRKEIAKDNAEAFYRYCNSVKKEELHNKNVLIYFILKKSSPDYKRLKKEGFKILRFNSLKHKMLFLISKKIISSQTTWYVSNIFSFNRKYYYDLYNFKYIFLQHGIIHSDLSNWLNYKKKKIDLLITTSSKERDSIISNENYGFPKENVQVLGLARFDELYNTNKRKKEKNVILFMPTWRKELAKSKANNVYNKIYNKEFKKTEYYNVINSILTNQKLIEKLKEHNYKIKLQLHPNLIQQAGDFKTTRYIKVNKVIEDYSKLFSDAKLLITDYSSISFDFAYIKKEIIYFQYDKELFYSSHTSQQGYFDFETDGFGDVIYNPELLVEKIIKSINNNCKLEEKYEKRIEDFFTYTDNNNCERIYNKVINMEE